MQPTSSVLYKRLLAKVRVRHLQVLVKLAEMRHVHRTAQAMGLTQPAVTLLLADLERLVEAPLFLRHAKGVTPTPLANDLLPLVRHMLSRLEEGAEVVASRLARDAGVVRAVATVAGANGLLADCLPALAQALPQLQVQVSEVDPTALSATLAAGAADVVFCRQVPVVPQGWAFVPCLNDRFVVVCGIHHPWARRRRLSLNELRGARWLPNAMATAARDRFETLLAQQGWAPQTCQVITRISALTWTLLDAEPLLCLVPYSVVRPWVLRGQLRVLPVDMDLPFDAIGMLLPDTGPSPAVQRLVAFVQAWSAQHQR